MSNINLNNYEAWFLDYFEGNLNEAQITELNSFLDKNPELRAEFEGHFENVTLETESINFNLKDELKKPALINHENVDDFMIAENEGLLDNRVKLELGAFVEANNLEADRKLYSLVYLAKTNAIRFPNKEKLKKGRAIVPLFIRYAAAAAIALLIAFALFYNFGKESSKPRFAEENPIVNPVEELINPEKDNFNNSNFAAEEESDDFSPAEKNLRIESPKETEVAERNKNQNKGLREKHGPDRKKKYQPQTLDNHVQTLAVSPAEAPKAMKPIEFELQPINDEEIAQSGSNNRTFTIWEYAGVKIKERILGQENVEDGRIRENDFAQALASSVNKVSNRDIITFEDRSSTNAIDYDFKLGKVGFNRSKNK